MRRVFVDVETYSEADLKKVGGARYAEDPSTELLMVAWGEKGAVAQWDISQGREGLEPFLSLVHDFNVRLSAWNARFEWAIFKHCLGLELPWARLHCDMAHAMSLGLPGALANAGPALGFDPEQMKMKEGGRLIRKFCQPRKPTKHKPHTRCTHETDPEDWELFCEYNRRDVIAEAKIYGRLRKWPMPDREWEHWMLDQDINQRGVPIDMDLARGALAAYESNLEALTALAKDITGLANPNSVTQLISWLMQRGVKTETLDKESVRDLLERDDLPEDVRELLLVRKEMAITSPKKFAALLRATSEDGRLRGSLQFYGAARTGRWAGRVFQPQNLPRGSLKAGPMRRVVERVKAGGGADMEELQSVIRAAVHAPEGKRLVVADLANIESRVLGWVSHDPTLLDIFASGRDPYKDFGTALLRKAEEDITRDERDYCKPPALGCGYGLGWRGLIKYAAGMEVTMTEEQSQHAVDVYRSRYRFVPELWALMERASKELVREGRGEHIVHKVKLLMDGPFLFMELPSGRRLAYQHPRIEMVEAPWGEDVATLTYMGVDQFTRQWNRLKTFGGKWVEQICQSISRDLLAEGLQNAEAMGFEVVLHTHDEIVALVDEDNWELDAERLCYAMTRLPAWADDELYLDAEGFEDVIYRKD